MITACAPKAGALRRALARLNAAAALLLLTAGGMVTSTASGLAVPDWPLSYGRWLPEMAGGVFFEHGHRMIAAGVGFLILVMAGVTEWEEERPGVRLLSWATLALVCLQGVLGGVTVFYGLPVAVSAAHAVLGQTLFGLLIAMAELVGEAPGSAERPARGLLGASVLALAALWGQLVLGAVLRHGGSEIAWHVLGAVAASCAVLWAGCKTMVERREPFLRGPAAALLSLLLLQLLLGAGAAAFRLTPEPRASRAMIAIATSHLAVGAFLLGTAALLTTRLLRLRSEAG